MLEESGLQSTPRYGGTRIVDNPLTYTENKDTLMIGNHSRKLSNHQKSFF